MPFSRKIARQLHPDFFRPGRIPTGRLALNPEHWLSQLISVGKGDAYFFSAHGYHEFGGNPVAGFAGETRLVPRGVRFDSSGGTDKVTLQSKISASNAKTVLFKFKMRDGASASNQGIYSDQNFTNWAINGMSINVRTSGGLLFTVNSKQAYTDTNYFLDRQPHTVACIHAGTALLKIYVDGVEVSYVGQQNGPATYTISSTIAARLGTYYTEGVNFTANGDLEYLIHVPTALTAEQCVQINADPYQILEPTTNYFWVPTPAAGGAIYLPNRGRSDGINRGMFRGVG